MAAEPENSDPSPLLALPQELLDDVCEDLDYVATIALGLTCRALYPTATKFKARALHRLKLHPGNSVGYTIHHLLEIEKWPCYDHASIREHYLKQPLATRDYFACEDRMRIRCTSKFTNRMMKGPKGKHSTSWKAKARRSCIDCNVNLYRFQLGTTFAYGGARLGSDPLGGGYGLVCRRCRQFKRIVDHMVEEKKGTCLPCLEKQRRQE